MGSIRPARPVNLLCGLISQDPDLIPRAVQLLKAHAGPTDLVSEFKPFDLTHYYEEEMGAGLQRQFVSFERLIRPDEIVHYKTLTNEIEARICHDLALPEDRRLVNIDPGYITLSKLVLVTTKDFSHRVYLRDGIYAEATLHFHDGVWHAWPWTYPDFADERYHPFLTAVRDRFKQKLGDDDPTRRVSS